MRVLHCLAQCPDKTGSGVYFRNLHRNWQAVPGLEQACLYALNADMPVPDLAPEQYPVYFETAELPFPIAGMSDVMPYRSTRYRDLDEVMLAQWRRAFGASLQEALRHFKPDLLIVHHLWILADLCCQLFDGPVVAFCHNTDLRQAEQNPGLFEREVRHLQRLAGVFVLDAEQIPRIERLYGLPAERMVIGGGAYDQTIFNPPESSERANPHELRFLYAGKIDPAKGIFELLQTFVRVKDPTWTLHLFGHVHEAEEPVLNFFLRHDPRIRFGGLLTQPELAREMRASDIFILPSFNEGLPLITLEALACGMRLVVNDFPALRRFMGERLWHDERLSVVPMPALRNLDRPEDDERPRYLLQLQAALEEQAARTLRAGKRPTVPPTLMEKSWQGLAERLWVSLENFTKC